MGGTSFFLNGFGNKIIHLVNNVCSLRTVKYKADNLPMCQLIYYYNRLKHSRYYSCLFLLSERDSKLDLEGWGGRWITMGDIYFFVRRLYQSWEGTIHIASYFLLLLLLSETKYFMSRPCCLHEPSLNQ